MRNICLLAALIAGCMPTVGSAGMELLPSGELVVSRVWTNELWVLDTATGEVIETMAVTNPDDVTVDGEGNLYVTSIFAGEVNRVQRGGTPTVVANIAGANAITYDARGRLWVGECFTGDDLYEVIGETARLAAARLGRDCALNGMVAGADGRLYGAQPNLQRVVAYNPDSDELEVLAEGLGRENYAVAFTPQGELLALREGEIVVIDREAHTFAPWATLGIFADNLVVAPDGEVFVSSSTTGEVIAVRADGTGRTVLAGSEGSTFGGDL
jgi:sugar lactone lactonase YvrE